MTCLHASLTAAAFRGSHVLVLSKNHVTFLVSIQKTQRTAEVCGNAAGRGHIFPSVPVFRYRQEDHCVIAEASRSRSQIALPHAVVGVERKWSDDYLAEDLCGIYVQIAPCAQSSKVGN